MANLPPTDPDETVRKLRSGFSILEGTIRNNLQPSKERQAVLKHVAAALALSIEAVRAVKEPADAP